MSLSNWSGSAEFCNRAGNTQYPEYREDSKVSWLKLFFVFILADASKSMVMSRMDVQVFGVKVSPGEGISPFLQNKQVVS